MLCTNCSTPIRPVVAIDIDGTLGDYHGHFLTFAEMFLGHPLPNAWRYSGGYPFYESMEIDKTKYREIKLAYRQGGLKRSMPAYDGAAFLIAALRGADIEVWLTTTRPYLRFDRIDPDTREWLARNKIRYDGLIYDEKKYERWLEILGDQSRVLGVVEDLPQLFDRASDLGLRPLHRWTNWNQESRRYPGANDLRNIWNLLNIRLKEWKNEQEPGEQRPQGANTSVPGVALPST